MRWELRRVRGEESRERRAEGERKLAKAKRGFNEGSLSRQEEDKAIAIVLAVAVNGRLAVPSTSAAINPLRGIATEPEIIFKHI